MKKNILFVGDNPFSMGGNGNMMAAIVSQLDQEVYQYSCFVPDAPVPAIAFHPVQIPILSAGKRGNQEQQRLAQVVNEAELDVLCMVGIDIWRYAGVFQQIAQIRKAKKFRWVWLFPYDLQNLRTDWVQWINALDFPCVYSRYGERLLKDVVPHIRYFRPPLYNSDEMVPMPEAEKEAARTELFPALGRDMFLFGFIGENQFRKDPQRLVEAFAEAKKENPNLALYLHMEMDGVFNIQQAVADYGINDGSVIIKKQHTKYKPQQMVKVYNAIDCYINCSMQEGLSLTVLEAMLNGAPVIASETTAQTEIVRDAGLLVSCEERAYIPMITGLGSSYVPAKCCKVEDITDAMLTVAGDKALRDKMIENGLGKSQNWLAGVCNINDLLEEALDATEISASQGTRKEPKVLFAQREAGGDVLMATACFKGIRKRHPNLDFYFMTQEKYAGIVQGNPYIDEIIEWDERLLDAFEVVYNPHGEKILPGGWNNLDVKLYSMYPYFCQVEADDMFIELVDPELPNLPDEYIVVHTTGGQIEYRGYKHMDMVLDGLEYPAVQVGSAGDIMCRKAKLDLRGKLKWRETAWVMKHAKAAIAIDSFPSHLAGAVGTPAVVLFGPAPSRVTGPKGDRIVCLEPNMLDVCKTLSHCWGNPPPGKRKCMSPCINSISPFTVKTALRGIMA